MIQDNLRHNRDGDNEENKNQDIDNFKIEPEDYFGIAKLNKLKINLFEDNQISYPVNSGVAFFHLQSHQTKFLNLDQKNRLNSFIGVPKLNLILIEEIDPYFNSNIRFIENFEEESFKKCSVNFINIGQNIEVIDISVSYDKLKFAIVTKSKAWVLTVWSFDKDHFKHSKLAEANLIDNGILEINQISFYPNDNRKILVLGEAFLSTYYSDHGTLTLKWKFPFSSNYLSHSWIRNNDLLIGNNSGHILIFSTEKLSVIKIIDVNLDLEKLLVKPSDENEGKGLKKESLTNLKPSDLENLADNQADISLNSNLLRDEKNDHDCQANIGNSLESFQLNSKQNGSKKIKQALGESDKKLDDCLNNIEISELLTLSNGFLCLCGQDQVAIYIRNSLNEYAVKNLVKIDPAECPSNFNYKII